MQHLATLLSHAALPPVHAATSCGHTAASPARAQPPDPLRPPASPWAGTGPLWHCLASRALRNHVLPRTAVLGGAARALGVGLQPLSQHPVANWSAAAN